MSKKYRITLNGVSYEVEVEELGVGSSKPAVQAKPAVQVETPKVETVSKPVVSNSSNSITAPMPGKIVDVCVSNGQNVKAGDTLFILEAMKMENEILAPHAGTVTVLTSKSMVVDTGDLLFVVS